MTDVQAATGPSAAAVEQRIGDLVKRARYWRDEAARCEEAGAERLARHAIENAEQCDRKVASLRGA